MWSRVIPPSCDSSFIRQQVGMMPRMPPPRIERMYRMICVALQLFYHSIRGTRVRLGPYVFSMRQAFPIQAALAQRKSNPVRYSLLSEAVFPGGNPRTPAKGAEKPRGPLLLPTQSLRSGFRPGPGRLFAILNRHPRSAQTPARFPLLGCVFQRFVVVSTHVVFDDSSAFHHKFDALHLSDVLQGVSGGRDQVGELALFDGADFVLPVDNLGIHRGCHAQRIEWRRSPTDEDGKHLALYAMGT